MSTATSAARRVRDMMESTAGVVSIEFLAAAQGVDLSPVGIQSPGPQSIFAAIRSHISSLEQDCYFAPDLRKMIELVCSDLFRKFSGANLVPPIGGL